MPPADDQQNVNADAPQPMSPVQGDGQQPSMQPQVFSPTPGGGDEPSEPVESAAAPGFGSVPDMPAAPVDAPVAPSAVDPQNDPVSVDPAAAPAPEDGQPAGPAQYANVGDVPVFPPTGNPEDKEDVEIDDESDPDEPAAV